MKGALTASIVAATGSVYLNREEKEGNQEEKEEDGDLLSESIEHDPDSLRFYAEVEGDKAFVSLRKDEVLFVDENSLPVGRPVRFEEFTIDRPATSSTPKNQIKEDGTVSYNLSAGNMNEIGVPEGGPAGEWLDYVKDKIQTQFPDRKVIKGRNIVLDYLTAYNEKDEPDLIKDIESGKRQTYIDLVQYFANKDVLGAEHLKRIEYARQMILFRSVDDVSRNRPAVPQIVQDELRRLIIGLFAKESKYNAGLVSKSGAAGLAQIKPKIWWEYTNGKVFATVEEMESEWQRVKDSVVVSLSMIDQIKVVGELTSDNYHYIRHFAGEEAVDTLRNKFSSDESFWKDLVVPLILNAYNAGGPLMGKIVKEFVQNYASEEMYSGKDLFLQIVDFARAHNGPGFAEFADDARGYVPPIYAQTEVLEGMFPQKELA